MNVCVSAPPLKRLIRTSSRINVLLLFCHVALLFETLVLEENLLLTRTSSQKNISISKLEIL